MSKRWFRAVTLGVLLFSVSGGCSGGCSALAPLPAPVPADQTVEGGVQVRVTKNGFDTLKSIVPGLINDALGTGFCLGGPISAVGVDLCGNADCAGGATGCNVAININSLDMTIPDPQTFRIDVVFDVHVPVPVDAGWLGSCTLDVDLQDAQVVADIGFYIDDATGELRIQLNGINTFDISNFSIGGCGVIGSILDAVIGAVADLLSSSIGNFIIDALTPVLDGFVQGLLPDPLGIEGVLDLGHLLGQTAVEGDGKLETKLVAGGYVSLPAEGLSLGMIVGLNADRDPSTRTLDLDNEPSLCVPPRGAPDFLVNPVLPIVPGRNTFALQPAEEFLGMPDPAADVALGVSKTILNLAGHHIISSGAMCVGIGSSTVAQLNLGTIGILVPSLAELGNGTGKEPILLVLRPQNALTFDIGAGTDTDPRLMIHIKDMEVDFYAFLYERYVRGFTISLSIDAGLNLDFVLDDMGKPAIQPTLTGITSDAIMVEVANAEFLREDPQQLEAVFPTLFDLVLPLLSEGLGPIALPEISGFTLSDFTTDKVVTSEDDFLAIYASLAPSGMKRAQMEASAKWLKNGVPDRHPLPEYTSVDTTAEVVRVTTPHAAQIRNALTGAADGAMPEVELALGGDVGGGQLEWQWNLDGGMWRPYSTDPHPVLRDRAFAVQGRHTLNVRARHVGDYRTFDLTPVELPIVIDSVGPTLQADQTTRDGDVVVFVGSDLVTEDADLEYSFTRTSDNEGTSATAWAKDARIATEDLLALADTDGEVVVRLRDEQGNETRTVFDASGYLEFHGRVPASGGCGCDVSSRQSNTPVAPIATLLGLALVGMLIARRRLANTKGLVRAIGVGAPRLATKLPFVAVLLVAGFSPACDCDSKPSGMACLTDADCTAECGPGKIPTCQDGMCFCADDIPIGTIGMYQDLGASPSGVAWVSAYNSTHGDLMAARVVDSGRIPEEDWEFVDGVPDGPVVLPFPAHRGGIRAEGDDVGIYTSASVTATDEPIVSYFDRTNGSLKFAGRFGDTWTTMVVDKGDAIVDPEIGGEEAGRYSSISVSPNDGRPAIAYMATVYDTGAGRTELRFAQAMVPQPSVTTDWSLYVVDQAPIPPLMDGQLPPTDLPEGLGLFVASARMPDGAPVLAYYDRINGDLKVALFDNATGQFQDPQIVDGADGSDVGQYPSIAVSPDGIVHITYVDAGRDNLMYINLQDNLPEVVDDGYRIDGMTEDGLPKPVFHLVGDDSGLVATGAAIAVAYQDATSHELLLSTRNPDGTWSRASIAGANDQPWAGGYGFYAAAEYAGQDIVMSTYVIDQPGFDYWVEVFRQPIIIE